MPEDQKNPAVSRNYLGSHKQRKVNDQESIDEQSDYSVDSSDSEDATASAQENRKQAVVRQSQKKRVPLEH